MTPLNDKSQVTISLFVTIALVATTFMTQNARAGLFADLKQAEQNKTQAEQALQHAIADHIQACANLRDVVVGSVNDQTVTPDQFEERVVNYNLECGNVTGNITSDTFRNLGGGL